MQHKVNNLFNLIAMNDIKMASDNGFIIVLMSYMYCVKE